MCAGFSGTSVDGALAQRLGDLALAGAILFAHNTQTLDRTRELTAQLRSVLDHPILAIDQEGGRVMRLREGVTPIPPMREVGELGDVEAAEGIGRQIGADLRAAGLNLNFAPVLDLARMPGNDVIGDRSFGSDPDRVTELGAAVARGLHAEGIVPTFKHFPGHGLTQTDTHLDLPTIDVDEAALRARDLVPFTRLLPGAQAVMTAHIVVRALDPENPATLSSRLLTGVLRGEIGFTGVCFTDCMEMDAIGKYAGTAQGAVRALRAGADCVLISHSLDLASESIEAIVAAVESRALSLERLSEAHERVARLRARLC